MIQMGQWWVHKETGHTYVMASIPGRGYALVNIFSGGSWSGAYPTMQETFNGDKHEFVLAKKQGEET